MITHKYTAADKKTGMSLAELQAALNAAAIGGVGNGAKVRITTNWRLYPVTVEVIQEDTKPGSVVEIQR